METMLMNHAGSRLSPIEPGLEHYILSTHDYFVRGLCLKGGRHYSATLDWETALKVFEEYKNIVYYYGGGYVELIGRDLDDYEVIKSEVCF